MPVISGLGMLNYCYSVLTSDSWRVTNMSTLMILSGVIVFLIGLLSEQLTNLQYKETDAGHE